MHSGGRVFDQNSGDVSILTKGVYKGIPAPQHAGDTFTGEHNGRKVNLTAYVTAANGSRPVWRSNTNSAASKGVKKGNSEHAKNTSGGRAAVVHMLATLGWRTTRLGNNGKTLIPGQTIYLAMVLHNLAASSDSKPDWGIVRRVFNVTKDTPEAEVKRIMNKGEIRGRKFTEFVEEARDAGLLEKLPTSGPGVKIARMDRNSIIAHLAAGTGNNAYSPVSARAAALNFADQRQSKKATSPKGSRPGSPKSSRK